MSIVLILHFWMSAVFSAVCEYSYDPVRSELYLVRLGEMNLKCVTLDHTTFLPVIENHRNEYVS